jgi:hypothetical protein
MGMSVTHIHLLFTLHAQYRVDVHALQSTTVYPVPDLVECGSIAHGGSSEGILSRDIVVVPRQLIFRFLLVGTQVERERHPEEDASKLVAARAVDSLGGVSKRVLCCVMYKGAR